jgi:polyphosphate kinase 2 (PPK2 family)
VLSKTFVCYLSGYLLATYQNPHAAKSLQDWVGASGERIIVAFEGRDAAGKGGTMRALTERSESSRLPFVRLCQPTANQLARPPMSWSISAIAASIAAPAEVAMQ